MLFVPGNNPSMVQTCPIYGADSIILDLEDSVAVSQKDAARRLVVHAILELDFGGAEIAVRINSPLTEEGQK
ncbi:MAG TPA: aldolase/citrate lyase family protein, partial [Thermogutta sp.]|nr:aldolase/citrate lyase family protein [Thermogutta sp.]